MNNSIVSSFALSFVCGALFCGFTVDAKIANAEDTPRGKAEYVSVDNAPVIDGIIDDVWFDACEVLDVVNGTGAAVGNVTILWNETGLYFLAEVQDDTVNNSDRCNLWVSETYYETREVLSYPYVDGAYFLCIGANNTMYEYKVPTSFNDKSGYPETAYQTATVVKSNGYVVEAYVPRCSEKALQKGESIGFDCSIDNYLAESTGLNEREGYRNWAGLGEYWEDPSILAEIQLCDYIVENGVAPTPTPNTTPSEPTTPDDSSTTKNEDVKEVFFDGCTGTVTLAPMTAVLFMGVALLKKKRN